MCLATSSSSHPYIQCWGGGTTSQRQHQPGRITSATTTNHHYHHQLPLRISKTIRLEKHIKFYEQSRNIKCTTPSTISLLRSRIPSAPGLFFGASIGCWQSWCYSFSYCCCCCCVMCHTYCSWCCVESCSVAPAAAPDVVLIVSVFMQTHLNNWRTFLPFPFRKDSKDNYYFFLLFIFMKKYVTNKCWMLFLNSCWVFRLGLPSWRPLRWRNCENFIWRSYSFVMANFTL